ncbi:MAG TPA: hypothetical protein VJ795_06905 [Rheinheimera sp.]|jgi:hypothetical protein|uniref:hypothetical protein n=1 Tax=Rheinheimera sp. TaxID=1869214 RepID=UPI002B4A9EC0|nr:hypothetical protein [Rheinheimera sp.]HJS14787.1 hypothetical protein [Rheinheimera sp.]
MEFYRLGLCLLLCSHPLLAELYWSHIPAVGSVQLNELSSEQHDLLAEHLKLSAEETTEWLTELPELLDALSCSTLDAQAQDLPASVDASYKLVGYAGVLKLYADDKSKKTIWWLPWDLLAVLAQLKDQLTDLDQQIHQPLLLTEQQLGIKGQLIIVSGSSNKSPLYFALELSSLEQPELLWSVSSTTTGFDDLAGAMAQPLMLQHATNKPALPAVSLLLPNTAATEKTLVYKVDLNTGAIQARLSTDQNISELSGAMTLYDHNRDSNVESLIFSTKAGQIWLAHMENNQFYDVKAIADLSGLKFSDIQFIRTLYAAVPVGGSGSDFHSRRSQWLVLLGALQQQNSVFVVLKQQDGQLSGSTDLVDRTLPKAPELAVLTPQHWQHIQQKNGWYSQLAGRLTHMPVVAAGVVYLTLLKQSADHLCSLEQSSSALMALHLHHASAVYRDPILPLDEAVGALKVKANTQGGFALIEQNRQQVLIENMLEISPDCTHCSKTIQQGSFPRWQLMGTYQNEEGAYE